MWLRFVVLLQFIFYVGCGKNEAVRPVGYYPSGPSNPYDKPYYPQQAPPPPGGNFLPPPYGPYNPGGFFHPGPGPANHPTDFYPFLPLYQYMNRNPFLTDHWNSLWNEWRYYSYRQGCGAYDFGCFWFDYCPSRGSGRQTFDPIYRYFDNNVYFWVTVDTEFLPNMNPTYFWEDYDWMSYGNIDNSIGCYDACGW